MNCKCRHAPKPSREPTKRCMMLRIRSRLSIQRCWCATPFKNGSSSINWRRGSRIRKSRFNVNGRNLTRLKCKNMTRSWETNLWRSMRRKWLIKRLWTISCKTSRCNASNTSRMRCLKASWLSGKSRMNSIRNGRRNWERNRNCWNNKTHSREQTKSCKWRNKRRDARNRKR